jgi:hypothetical protein
VILQATQAVSLTFLYVPFGHAVQGPPTGPVYPALQGCGAGVVVVGWGVVVELIVGSGVVELEVGSGVVELEVGSGVVELEVGSGVVELEVGSGVVELEVGSGVVDVVTSVQGPPAGPVYPLLHRQSCTDTLASREKELEGHEEQSIALAPE